MANQAYAELKQYILRKLGSPVINIEITDDQLEDCIDEALEDFHEEHYGGTFIGYLPFTLTAGATAYQLDDNVQEVVQIITSDDVTFNWRGDDPLLISAFYLGNEHYSLYKHDLVSVEVYRQNFKMFADYFEIPIRFDYNSTTRRLYLATEPENDMDVFLRVFQSDDDQVAGYLKDGWVKAYATALARLQWGDNLSKYDGANLPGGATFNYAGIIERAQGDIERLKEELEDKFSLPIDPQVG